MKNLFLMAAFLLCSALTAHAQEISLVNNEEAPAAEAVQTEQATPALMPAWVELSSANANAIAQTTDSERAYNSGRALKIAGMITTIAAGATAAALFIAAADAHKDDSVPGAIGEAISLWYGIVATGVAGVGGVLWAVGAHKMKVNSNGSLAYTF